ncbi:MAG: lactate utilization protein C [Alphaproteobacteria bacterium]|nr:lactate utilization protein C [Alphaproteobacteria bacterium]
MSEPRTEILGKLRRALARTDSDAAAVDARIAAHTANLVPARGQVPEPERVAMFRAMAGEVGGTTEELAGPAEVPAAVARYLAGQNLPARAAMAPDPLLQGLPWTTTVLELRQGRTHGDDLVGITAAFAGVAETGTLVTLSGPTHPTTLNFLSETHVVVLPRRRLAGAYEEVWARLRALGADVPRTVNMITGPSRTADIEQTIQRGAHGPRRLHILIVDGLD